MCEANERNTDDAVEQHLASELLGDEDFEEDVDELKAPGFSRSAAFERDQGGKERSPYLSTAAAIEKPSEPFTAGNDQPGGGDTEYDETSDSARNRISPAREAGRDTRDISRWNGHIEPDHREPVVAEREGIVQGRDEVAGREGMVVEPGRGDFVSDRPWRADAEFHKGFDGPPRRESNFDYNRRIDGIDPQRRADTFGQGRRMGGDGFPEQGRRVDGFDSRRGGGFDSRRVDGFEPRRVDPFDGPRRPDGFDDSRRSENLEQHKRNDTFEQGRRPEIPLIAGRWTGDPKGHDHRGAGGQYAGDRGPAPIQDASRYVPKADMRHDFPRGPIHPESPRVPLTDSGSIPYSKGGPDRYPPQKEWTDERDITSGGGGSRYPVVRPGPEPIRSVPGGRMVNGPPEGRPEGRWSHDVAGPDAPRVGPNQGRIPISQNQSGNDVREIPAGRGNDVREIPAGRRLENAPGNSFHGNPARGRETESQWAGQPPGRAAVRGFSDSYDAERGRERPYPGGMLEPPGGFPGPNAIPNPRNGALQSLKAKSPPRQATSSMHEDRRQVEDRRAVEPRIKDPRDQGAPNNFSGPISPRTPGAIPTNKPGTLQLPQNAGPLSQGPGEMGRMESKSRWGRNVQSDGALPPSQSAPLEKSMQSHSLRPPQGHQVQQTQPSYQQQPQPYKQQGPSHMHPPTLDQKRPEAVIRNVQHGDGERADLRNNIGSKKRKLEEEVAIPAGGPQGTAVQNFEAQPPIQNSDRQRNVISLKGINQSVRRENQLVQDPGFGNGNVQKLVRTVRSDELTSTQTTVTITGINVEDHRGSWGQGNKGRGGFHGGGGRGRGRG
jgi:hypothetical protein